MEPNIQTRQAEFNSDYERVAGRAIRNFFCPILRIDSPVNIIRGHVLPQSTNGAGPWVPQREDVDNTFGSLFESNLRTAQARDRPAIDFLCDKNLNRATKPAVTIDGIKVGYYTTNGVKRVKGHTPLVVEVGGSVVANFNMKVDLSIASSVNTSNFDIRLNKDFSPEVWAAATKAAHLTLFNFMGYKHVLSPSGDLLSDILSKLYKEALSTKDHSTLLRQFFNQNEFLVRPIKTQLEIESSIVSKRFWICLGSNGRPFSLVVLVRFGKDLFCVFTPCDAGSIDVYFSFLQSPPASVAIKEVLFNDDSTNPTWGINEDEPLRVSIL